ncbi:hypothetical protein O7602_26815 [Micromonospora sp. WMMD1128]|uniref:hypothetical protein n=1 Tax=Micromonospora sp. WMMD1128 TaxID=3015150 RepID=UPI00248AAC74|nr:hypothetical protein [Micromonospora sp. WMMD1128]WBB73255.1 hypothetical protein O7602_26815 [Micromonospora sp. WMMD1128]
MHPHHLHALAAAWSLHDARQTLDDLARDEAAQIAAERLEAPSLLRSTVYGGRPGSGSHSDPTPRMIAVADRPERRNRWAEMAERCTTKVTWLARQLRTIDAPPVLDRMLTEGVLGPEGEDDPLDWLIVALRYALPGTAAAVLRHLLAEEAWVRPAIGQRRPTQLLIGATCPGCDRREVLTVQTAGPKTAWTVVCVGRWEDNQHNPCLCLGAECGCGMPGAVEGVAHIWRRDHVLRAVAGAAPTQTN